jgi:Flp pilus assembly protein TadD
MRHAVIIGAFQLAVSILLGQAPEVLVQRAHQDVSAGRFAQAEDELSRAVEGEPGKWNLWYDLGVVRIHLGEIDTAIQAFERAHRLAPQIAPPDFGLGLAYMKRGDGESALHAYSNGLARDPNDSAAILNYAFLLTQKGDFNDAVKPLKKLKSLQPGNVPARVALIEAYLKAGMRSAGEEEVSQFLSAHIATMQEELSLARLLLTDREGGEAAVVLRDATATWPEASEPHEELGMLLMQEAQFEPAVRELGRASQLDPNSAECALGLGEALLRWRHDPVALKYLLAVKSKFGKLPLYQFELGLAYFYLTRFPEAEQVFESLARSQPKSSRVQFFLGATYQAMGNLDQAQACYRKAIALKPDEASYYVTLATLLKKVNPGELSEPVRLIQKALSLNPGNEDVKLLLASCYQAQGKLPLAQALLETVVASDPGFRAAHVALAQVYFREKRVKDAEQQESIAAKQEERKQSEISPWGPGGVARP